MQNVQFILFILLKKAGLKRGHKVLDLTFKLEDILKPYIGSENYNIKSDLIFDFILVYDLFIYNSSIYELKLFFKNIEKICDKKTKILISVRSTVPFELSKKTIYEDKQNAYFTIEQFKNIASDFGFKSNPIRNPERDLFPHVGSPFTGDKYFFVLIKN